ncbi:hypothetical protein QAD02_001028 [Eretmocerus hayati]|uniref:Uncharacterized protein n=1 Tax=Eretmocerus hayati TaxID=131215 RepID=A0ACC2NHF6_9HYME|nr:hypothetical protein QAD02_001028 [Eretmocerus hayati]
MDTSTYENSEDFEGENEVQNQFRQPDSTLFLLDGTKKMHKKGYFKECLEKYRDIIREKCCNNDKDKMGLVVLGTNDSNCGVDHLWNLQEFSPTSVDSYKSIRGILKDINKYESLATESKFPLYDALTHAFQVFHLAKTNTKTRNIILLCTCNDNPCIDASNERRRIEHLVATFKDTQIELQVVGLSDSWNDQYYKDLQMISGTYTDSNYRRTSLNDLIQDLLSPARSIASLPWKIGGELTVDVSIMNLISATRLPTKIKLEKDENEVLEARQFLVEQKRGEAQVEAVSRHHGSEDQVSQDHGSQDLPELGFDRSKFITSDSIRFYQTHGHLNISFTSSECRKIKNMNLEPGITVLAFKPISCEPLYHVRPANFVTYSPKCDDCNKTSYDYFVSKCSEKEVMPICSVITTASVIMCMMIPSEDDGGFFMYQIPVNDGVRNLDEHLADFIFNDEKQCVVNDEAVEYFKEMMEMSKIDFDPKVFKNPKLEKCIAHIEALALDEELRDLPPDSTLPPARNGTLKKLQKSVMRLFDLTDVEAKQKLDAARYAKRQKLDLKGMAKSRELHHLTVAQLKEFLKDLNLSCVGYKSTLVQRIYDHFKC